MSLKTLFGLENSSLSDTDIMTKLKTAFDKKLSEVEFVKEDGSKVIIKLPEMNFSQHIDPWDGMMYGKKAA